MSTQQANSRASPPTAKVRSWPLPTPPDGRREISSGSPLARRRAASSALSMRACPPVRTTMPSACAIGGADSVAARYRRGRGRRPRRTRSGRQPENTAREPAVASASAPAIGLHVIGALAPACVRIHAPRCRARRHDGIVIRNTARHRQDFGDSLADAGKDRIHPADPVETSGSARRVVDIVKARMHRDRSVRRSARRPMTIAAITRP